MYGASTGIQAIQLLAFWWFLYIKGDQNMSSKFPQLFFLKLENAVTCVWLMKCEWTHFHWQFTFMWEITNREALISNSPVLYPPRSVKEVWNPLLQSYLNNLSFWVRQLMLLFCCAYPYIIMRTCNFSRKFKSTAGKLKPSRKVFIRFLFGLYNFKLTG